MVSEIGSKIPEKLELKPTLTMLIKSHYFKKLITCQNSQVPNLEVARVTQTPTSTACICSRKTTNVEPKLPTRVNIPLLRCQKSCTLNSAPKLRHGNMLRIFPIELTKILIEIDPKR